MAPAFQQSIGFANQSDHPVTLWIEPWGDAVTISPQDEVTLAFTSDRDGRLDIIQGEDPAIWAWSGCTFAVLRGTEVIRSCAVPVPDYP